MTQLTQDILNKMVNVIVETAHPLKIILFGSAERDEMRPSSDQDILDIMPPDVHRRKTAKSIYRNLVGVGFAADIVVVTEKDIERYRDNIGMVIKPALEHGSTLYAR